MDKRCTDSTVGVDSIGLLPLPSLPHTLRSCDRRAMLAGASAGMGSRRRVLVTEIGIGTDVVM